MLKNKETASAVLLNNNIFMIALLIPYLNKSSMLLYSHHVLIRAFDILFTFKKNQIVKTNLYNKIIRFY